LLSERQAQRLRLLLVAGLLAPAAMVLVGYLLAWLLKTPTPYFARWPDWMEVGAGVAAAGLSMGSLTLLAKLHPVLERALRRSGTRVGLDALEMAGYPVMLVMVTMAAFGEEVLFRGALQPMIGLVPAALLFGFSHGGWRREMWAYGVAAALSGLLFGAAYWLTGVIWVPVIAHAIHNIASTILLGKKVDVQWDAPLPRVRLLPEPDEEEVQQGQASADAEPQEVAADEQQLGEPVFPEGDGEAPGADDGDSADRRPE